jgi:hypothetical protein
MLKEKIVSLENGLDPRIVALSRIKALESLVNSFDPFSGNEIVSSYLGYYDGVLSYIAEVSDNMSVNLVHTPFEIEDYNYCLNQYKNLLEGTDEHFFSDVNAKRLLYLPNEKCSIYPPSRCELDFYFGKFNVSKIRINNYNQKKMQLNIYQKN